MTNLTSVRQSSANLSITLQESTKQMMNDVQQGISRLDRKKEAISDAGLERLQESNSIASRLSEQRTKIDTFA